MKYIASYNGKGGDITLPKDCYVGDYAFFGNTEITSVTAPCDYYFGSGAFMDCTNLKKVVVKGNAEFGTSSFVECINLKSVSVEGSLINIYGSAFGFCRSLTDFTVKEDKEEFAIGASAFSYCYSLKE
ncbi:MAG: leucine-rich repeat domain-containing protein, partial [Oscillospiraceae bacterium]|nr:leucine-rich repeat domain-containing protein [Oscillospiraceae bacterium]